MDYRWLNYRSVHWDHCPRFLTPFIHFCQALGGQTTGQGGGPRADNHPQIWVEIERNLTRGRYIASRLTRASEYHEPSLMNKTQNDPCHFEVIPQIYDPNVSGELVVKLIVVCISWAIAVTNTELLIKWNHLKQDPSSQSPWQFGQVCLFCLMHTCTYLEKSRFFRCFCLYNRFWIWLVHSPSTNWGGGVSELASMNSTEFVVLNKLCQRTVNSFHRSLLT